MSNFSDVLLTLAENPIDEFEETCRLLVKIADNVLSDPSNPKYRTLQKSNATISRKILRISGGVECLKLMGFQENGQTLSLPSEVPLVELRRIRNEIQKLEPSTSVSEMDQPKAPSPPRAEPVPQPRAEPVPQPRAEPVPQPVAEPKFKKVVLPPFQPTFTNAFLQDVERRSHMALVHEDAALQERARSVIPIAELERRAQEKLRSILERVKKDKLPDPEINLQDTLVLELLSWFKEDFFEWTDSPACSRCGAATAFSHMSDDRDLLTYADRVEMHACGACRTLTPFPRYNDLNILLETRTGRCGEWANTFTLMCRAMGWDARHVFDCNDHVWTEVYSYSQKRWLHCDPCENVCDAPLMYENGWKKEMSYVMAYSAEEVQDVTWRYTSDHYATLRRRRRCTEAELVEALDVLRRRRQENVGKSRKEYLVKRLLGELVELMVERKPSDKDLQGRTSGSLAWRLSRNEAQDEPHLQYTWTLSSGDLSSGRLKIEYSPSSDIYRMTDSNGKVLRTVDGWRKGAFERSGVFRKVEKDWKMVYLCRTEGAQKGSVSWKFAIDDATYVFDEVELLFERKVFEDGSARVRICGADDCDVLKSDENVKVTQAFSGSRQLTIEADLSGGRGDVAWQHAQLFRQSLDSADAPFSIRFTFKRTT